jgi:integrase
MTGRALPRATLRVKDQGGGPTIYARWRDPDDAAKQVERRIGKAWMVRKGEPGARPNGATIGDWRARSGRAPDGYLTPDAARERVPEVVAEWFAERDDDQRRAALQGHRTVRELCDAWLEAGAAGALGRQDGEPWKHSTVVGHRHIANRVCRALGPDTPVEDVTEEGLRAFLAALKPERNGEQIADAASRKTRANYTVALRTMFAHAAELGWIGDDPSAAIRVPRKRRRDGAAELRREEYLEPDEVRAVAEEARRGYVHDQTRTRSVPRRAALVRQSDTDAAMVLTLGMTGLRAGEAVALRWRDVDLAASKIVVRESRTLARLGTPKSGHGRTVPLAPEVAQELARLGLRGFNTGDDDLVFVGLGGGFVDLPKFRQRYYAAQQRASISPRRTVHMLRHTFAIALARHGVPLATIQRYLGHGSITVTEIYSAFVPGDREAAMVSAAFASADA